MSLEVWLVVHAHPRVALQLLSEHVHVLPHALCAVASHHRGSVEVAEERLEWTRFDGVVDALPGGAQHARIQRAEEGCALHGRQYL